MSEEEKDQKEVNNNRGRKKIALVIIAVIILVGIIAGYLYLQYKKSHISTDDAFVNGTIHTISSRVPGTVYRIYVSDNQFVKKGTLLLELEEDIYRESKKQAEAALSAEEKRLEELEATIKAQQKRVALMKASLEKAVLAKKSLESMVTARKADVTAKKALLKKTKTDLDRAQQLHQEGVIPDERLDSAETAYETAKASLHASQALLDEATISLKSHDSVISEAEAALLAEKENLNRLSISREVQREIINRSRAEVKIARLNLSYIKIYAPSDGYITKKSVTTGNQIQAGQPLMAIVPLDDVYVIANYKETKIKKIKPGQKVTIKVDAYPGKVFTGKVQSIMAGTGSVFSLFPPENATGNYVKVVQRIPVKIMLDKDSDSEHILRIGMSVIPTILTDE